MKFVDRWGKGVLIFLSLAIALLGVGRIDIPFLGVRFSSWSISRTTVPFWLIWRLLAWIRNRQAQLGWQQGAMPLPLLLFFLSVTASLLPDFRQSGDYRYFLFAFFHYIMVADVFSQGRRPWLLVCLLGIAPGVLLIRGCFTDPSVLNLNQMVRFGYPLDHPNTAGYVFSMGAPLALAVMVNETGWLRSLGGLSFGAQMFGLALTYSRGAWLGCVVSMLFLGFSVKRLRKIFLVMAFLLVFMLVIPPLQSRLLTLGDPLNDLAINERIHVMKDAFYLGLANPLLGIGYGRGRLKEAIREMSHGTELEQAPIWHAHNVYLDLFAGTGLLGVGAFWCLLLRLGYRFWRKAYEERQDRTRSFYFCLLSALIAFMVTGLGDMPFYHHETRIFFFTLLALIYLHLRGGQSESGRLSPS